MFYVEQIDSDVNFRMSLLNFQYILCIIKFVNILFLINSDFSTRGQNGHMWLRFSIDPYLCNQIFFFFPLKRSLNCSTGRFRQFSEYQADCPRYGIFRIVKALVLLIGFLIIAFLYLLQRPHKTF